MEINLEKTVYDVKLKQDAVWSMVVAIFWLVAAVLFIGVGTFIAFVIGGELRGLFSALFWIAGAVFGLIGLVKGIRLIWQNWG